ncbi:MAG: 3-isopropylmalate dehydratase small subunit [Spirochaetales bacterium]|nr:3-isopropylmalate dehydratase small subunit [Spirochaetales bacterium]
MRNFNGKVLFLDRSDINTDEIIPAKYLTEVSKEALKPFCLEDLKIPGFAASSDVPGKAAIITRANFGCGSSREHAPWALEVNGINIVIAENFARIFRQNMYNNGMIALELPKETLDEIFRKFSKHETEIQVDPEAGQLRLSANGSSMDVDFSLGGFDLTLVKAGGWLEFADSKY